MTRTRLALIALALAAAAGGAHWMLRTSYARHDTRSLGLLEAEAERLKSSEDPQVRLDADVELRMISGERLRRILVGAGILGATASLIAAILIPRRRRKTTDEEHRLAKALAASPGSLEQEKLRAAAELLGISVHAAPSVIEAAFEAQLEQRAEGRFANESAHLKRVAASQREALHRARETLLSASRARSERARTGGAG